MKLLLDSCIWKPAKSVLEQYGYDVIHVGEWDRDPGDEEILKFAYQEKRILITNDKDFGKLILVNKKPHNGIIRLVKIAGKNQSHFILRILNLFTEILVTGAILTASENGVRIRPPEK